MITRKLFKYILNLNDLLGFSITELTFGGNVGSVVFNNGIHLKLTLKSLLLLQPYKYDQHIRVTSRAACGKHWAWQNILADKFRDVDSVSFFFFLYIFSIISSMIFLL